MGRKGLDIPMELKGWIESTRMPQIRASPDTHQTIVVAGDLAQILNLADYLGAGHYSKVPHCVCDTDSAKTNRYQN